VDRRQQKAVAENLRRSAERAFLDQGKGFSMTDKIRDTIRDCLEMRRDELVGRLDRYGRSGVVSQPIADCTRAELADVEAALLALKQEIETATAARASRPKADK
jgi:hypothetical protein